MIATPETHAPPIPEVDTDDFEIGASAPTASDPGGMLADSAIGIFNNLIAIGGGWFVKIQKKEAFYDLEEFVQLIDEQNERNVKRLQLDEADKALLRPLLAQALAKYANKIGPEYQFLAVAFSILMKKFQMIMAIRTENQHLEQRLVNIIEGKSKPFAQPEPEKSDVPIPIPESRSKQMSEPEEVEEVEEVSTANAVGENPTPNAVEEVDTGREVAFETELDVLEKPALMAATPELEPKVMQKLEEKPNPASEVKPKAPEMVLSSEPSNYEKRIVNAFAQTAKDAGSNSQALLVRIGMETGELEGVWFSNDIPFRVEGLKDILKMIFGSTAGLIPGIGSLAKTKIRGFFAAKAEAHGVIQQRIGLGLSCNEQGRIIVQMAVPGKIVETLSVDQLVEQLQNGGVVHAT